MIENSLEDEDDKRSLHDWNERFQSAIDRMRSFSAYTPIKGLYFFLKKKIFKEIQFKYSLYRSY